jgi:hypothetical protein
MGAYICTLKLVKSETVKDRNNPCWQAVTCIRLQDHYKYRLAGRKLLVDFLIFYSDCNTLATLATPKLDVKQHF